MFTRALRLHRATRCLADDRDFAILIERCTFHIQRRLLNNRPCQWLRWDEFHLQGLGLVLQVFEAARRAGGGHGKGFGFIVGLPADDQRPDARIGVVGGTAARARASRR